MHNTPQKLANSRFAHISRLTATLCAALAGTCACTAVAPVPRPPVIGLLADISGSSTVSGLDATRGAELAIDIVDDVSTSGPLALTAVAGLRRPGGAKVVLATADTKGNADQAAKQADDLITARHAVAVVLVDSADTAAATASEMQRWRVPLLDAANTADYLSELGMDWYFRLGPSDRSMAESAVALVRRHALTRNGIQAATQAALQVEVVAEPGGDSATGTALLAEMADRAGITISATKTLTPSGSEGHLAVDPATSAVLAWAHTTGSATAIVRAVGAEPGAPPLIGLGAGFRQLTRPADGPLTLRPMAWSPELAARMPVGRAVMRLYQERFGVPMTEVAAMTFTAVLALAAAMTNAGSADPAAIRAALRQPSLSAIQTMTPWNGVRFAADGQNSLAAPIVEAWDGTRFTVVSPAELAVKPLRWPGTQQ